MSRRLLNAPSFRRFITTDIPHGNVLCSFCSLYCGGRCSAAEKDRMAKLAAAVSLVPSTDVKPKMVVSPRLNDLLSEYLETSAKLDQLTAKKKALSAELLTKWNAKHGLKIETAEFLETEVQSYNSTISAEKLAELGVKATVIEKARVKTPYSYPKVTRKKEAIANDLQQKRLFKA